MLVQGPGPIVGLDDFEAHPQEPALPGIGDDVIHHVMADPLAAELGSHPHGADATGLAP
jgi:hypothetical protein